MKQSVVPGSLSEGSLHRSLSINARQVAAVTIVSKRERSARRDRAGRERRGHCPVIGEASVPFRGWKRLQVAGDRFGIASSAVQFPAAPLEHPRRRVDADFLARHARHNERDAPPVRRRPAGVGCPVGQDHVTLALASLPIGFGAVVAD